MKNKKEIQENWEKELVKKWNKGKWYKNPDNLILFIHQEKEKWERKFLDELEKWIGVDNLSEFLENLKDEK